MALTVDRLPRYLVLEPVSTVRFDLRLSGPGSEVDVELENPGPGRSFLLMVGPPGGPLTRRLQLTGGARILFGPTRARPQILMLANPLKQPLVLELRGRPARAGRPRLPRFRSEAAPRPTCGGPARIRSKPRVRLTRNAPEPEATEAVGPGIGAGLRRARPKG